jgi:hypothetical protein
MGAADGTVVGLTKLVDAGPPEPRWNLVLVADGYQASELVQFATDAQDLVDSLFIEPPFDSLTIACAINVYRLDVSSTESGADKPDCSDGGGDGSSRATYFDSTFCADGDTQRLLYGNRALAEDTVGAHLPQWHQIIVICNDPERGGGGGSPAHPVGWTSNSSSDWREAAIHEMGHSAFGLADEYDVDGDDDSYSGDDFYEPNVSNDPDPATVKWSALVTAGATVPTLANPDCTQPSAGTDSAVVGTFEGANHYHCGAYRPVHRCKMRESTAPFCPVCSGVIVDTMQPFAVPAPSGDVSLATPVVDFNDVPTGLSVVRAARFDVESCFAVIFQVMDTPAAPFALESPSFVFANPSGPTPWKGYVWFRMTCPGSVGPVTPQTITIRCLETGEDFEVTLTGNCVVRPTVVTQLVFDRSASMLDLTDEGRTKEAVLKESASAFVDLLYDDNGIGINAYDHDPHPVMDIGVADAPGAGGGRDAAVGAISSFAANPAGLTAIGDGIELAKQRLDDASGYDEKAMIVLTDGIETADKRIADVADTVINEKVFAIGLGTAEQIRPAALDALTAGTAGYLLMTGNLSSDETFLLSKYYLQILAGVNNDDLVLDPEGSLRFGQVARIPFDVVESDVEIAGIVLARPAHLLQMTLETPDGSVVTGANASVLDRSTGRTAYMRAGLPLLADGDPAHAGRWHLLLAIGRKYGRVASHLEGQSAGSIRYSASVTAYSNLRMSARVDQDSLEPGATLSVRAVLTEYGAPFLGSAHVQAQLTRPDDTVTFISLPAVAGETGAYATTVPATMSGIYRFRILASGRTVHDQHFTREQLRTGAVWRGGDQPGGGDGSGTGGDPGGPGGPSGPGGPGGVDVGTIIRCLLCEGVLSPELLRRFEAAGIDVKRLCRCLGQPPRDCC